MTTRVVVTIERGDQTITVTADVMRASSPTFSGGTWCPGDPADVLIVSATTEDGVNVDLTEDELDYVYYAAAEEADA